MDTIGITFQRGGLSKISYKTLSPWGSDVQSNKCAALWRGRHVKDTTHIHLEEEVFLLGNLYSLKKLGIHLARGVIGFVAGAGTLGILWITSKQIRQLTTNLFQIPRDIFKCIPILGNKMVARENLAAFEEAEKADKAKAEEADKAKAEEAEKAKAEEAEKAEKAKAEKAEEAKADKAKKAESNVFARRNEHW